MKNVIAFLCLFLCSMIGISQNQASLYDLPTVIPSSPEVSSILRYSEVPVSYYNGIPNIEVPMYTLQGRELAAPINLSYHAGGHRVNEEASRVGLGWNLSAGGQISRVVKGLPDDYVNGFIHTNTTATDISWACSGGDVQLCKQIRETSNTYDPEPDDFNYSALGLSGRFMFNQKRDVNAKGEIVQFPERNVKIVPIFNGNTIDGWEITDTNGTLYEFSAGNKFIRSQSYQKKNGQFSIPTDGGTSLSYIETWNLTKVTSLNGDELTFEYAHDLLPNDTATRWEFSHGGESLVLNPLDVWTTNSLGNHAYTIANPYTTESFNTSYRYIEELSKITSNNGYVKFIQAAEQRLDMRSNAKRLQFIEVYNNQDQKLQEIEFFHDYFESTPRVGMLLDHANSAPQNAQSIVTRRLNLQKVQFRGGYNSNAQEDHYEYSFAYNTSEMLPDKQSYAQDHWGYYNGAIGNTSLLAIPNGIQISNGANREVNPAYSSACMLERITYPEGGVTRLFYENNKGDIKSRSLPPYIEKEMKVKALSSHQHTIAQNGNATVYRFYSNDFTIASDAKSAPGDSSKTQASYTGLSNRCDNVAAIFNTGDLVCNTMFFKLFKVGSLEPPITGALWESGYVLLDKGATYRLEIEITSTNNDYSLVNHYSEVELNWFEKTPTTTVETADYFGGLRIEGIKTYDDESGLASYKSYSYAGGSIVSAPIYLSKDLSFQEGAGTFSAGFYFPIYRITSNSSVPLLTTQSGYVGYNEVIETIHEVAPSNRGLNSNDRNTKSIIRTYSKANNYTHIRQGGVHVYDWRDGNLLTEDAQNKQISNVEYVTLYGVNNTTGVNLSPPIQSISAATISRVFSSPIPTFGQLEAAIDRDVLLEELGIDSNPTINPNNPTPIPMYEYALLPGQMLPNKNSVTTREGNLNLTQVTDTYYESAPAHYNPTKTVTTDSKGDVYETVMRYPYEENHTILLNENRINIPLVTTSSQEGTIISTVKSEYGVFEGKHQVTRILGAKENGTLEERVRYHAYTPYGQPRQVSKTEGTSITYIWGYNYTYPVAKIENATYAQVSALIDETSIQNLTGTALENALASLYTDLPNAMVSTYEFEPMIGMIKSTDPRGRHAFYKYDPMGRLEFVLDHEGNVLSQNTYHYKNN